MGIWSPFDNEEKRARLTFIGGGLAAAAAAVWALFTYFNPPKPAPEAATPPAAQTVGNVTASGGSVAGGRDVIGATVNPAPTSPPPMVKIEPEPTPEHKSNPKKHQGK